jgi:hypothetical protein
MSKLSSSIRVFRADGCSLNASDRAAIESRISRGRSRGSDKFGTYSWFHEFSFRTFMVDKDIEGVEIHMFPGEDEDYGVSMAQVIASDIERMLHLHHLHAELYCEQLQH